MKNINVKDKVVIITGASGFIGKSLANEFANCGAKVIIADIDDIRGEAAAREIRDKGLFAEYIHYDQREEKSVNDAVLYVKNKFGRIDVMINNAGVNIPQDCRRPINEFMDEKFLWMMDVDFYGLIRSLKAVLPVMKEQGCGSIINTTSVNSYVPLRMQCAFPAAKNAANILTKSVAAEYAPFNIRVNAIAPGSTPMTDGSWQAIMHDDQNVELIKHIPMKRQALVDEMAGICLYFATDELSSYTTGQIVCVDGGWTIAQNF